MTHADLVVRAERWLRNTMHRSIIFTEQHCGQGEIPDAIGWKAGFSYLVECKTSPADFLADLKKPFRLDPTLGMGHYRYLMCPFGVLPLNYVRSFAAYQFWGLLWVRRQVEVLQKPEQFTDRDANGEIALLLASLRRCEVRAGQCLTSWLKYSHRIQNMNGGATLQTPPRG